MVNALSITTGVLAVIGIAPWVIYLGALAKITEVISNGSYQQATKQTVIMLEWYTVAAQFVNLVILAICSFVPHAMKRTHSMFSNWFAVNTALIIYRTTQRIIDLNSIEDGFNPGNVIAPGSGSNISKDDAEKYLAAEIVGMIVTSFWNFLLSIFFGIAGTGHVEPQGKKEEEDKPAQPVAA